MAEKLKNAKAEPNALETDKFYAYEGKLATTPIISFISEHGHKCRGRLLDIGCGKKPYRRYFSQVDEYIGVDIKGEVDIIANAKSLPVENTQKHCDYGKQLHLRLDRQNDFVEKRHFRL